MGHFSHISYAALSDVGRKRKNNEDSFGTFPSVGIFCVADGMGGGDDGEVASSATVHAVEKFAEAIVYPPKLAYPIDSIISGLRSAINFASCWISKRTQEKNLKGCGSTFVGVCFDAAAPDKAVALHAGDSRLYRIRGRAIQQITKDHSAAELIGAKDENDINPMFRGMILRAVGIQKSVEVDATAFDLKEGDRVLICSDGLSKMLPDKRIASIVKDSATVDDAAKKLVAAANDAGGLDNVTVVVLEVGKLPIGLPTVAMTSEMAMCVDDGTEFADGRTQDTNADTGVSFDLGSASSTNTSCGSDGETESVTCSTMTIPEDDTDAIDGEAVAPVLGESARPEKSRSVPSSIEATKRRKLSIFAYAGIAVLLLVLLAAVLLGGGGKNIYSAPDENATSERNEVSGGAAAPDAVSETERKRLLFEEETRKKEQEAMKRREEEALKRKEDEARKRREAEIAAEAECRRLEAERRRLEEDRRRREEEEARRREEEQKRQQAEARRIEEEYRKRANEAKRKAAQERERKRKEELERIANEKALAEKLEKEKAAAREKMRREAAYVALKRVCVEETAASFVRKVQTLVSDELRDAVCPVFRPMLAASGGKESEAAAIELTRKIQPIVAKLSEYAALYRMDAEAELNDPATTSAQRRRQLQEVPEKMKLFTENARRILGKDAKDSDVHMACAMMIEMVPLWF